MAVVAARNRGGMTRSNPSEFCIELGILNNMPDAALENTERQFFTLLATAAPDLLVRVRFFSLSTFARGSSGREHLKRHAYTEAAGIPHWNLDALIVTGTEPRKPDLRDESYWTELTQTFDWIAEDGPSTLFSCLAAHAAVFYYDGIERRRLEEKRFGIFQHVVVGRDMLTHNLPHPLKIAHSRWNELSESDLAARGYRILTWSPEAGVELFLKRGRRDLLFCQGHPEYDPLAVGREYRRDVRRYLSGETAAYPVLPKNYYSAADILTLQRFRGVAASERSEPLMARFPSVGPKDDSHWHPPGSAILRAWLRSIVENKRRTGLRRQTISLPAFAVAHAT